MKTRVDLQTLLVVDDIAIARVDRRTETVDAGESMLLGLVIGTREAVRSGRGCAAVLTRAQCVAIGNALIGLAPMLPEAST